MRQIFVPLPEASLDELRRLAERNWRPPKQQAAVLILEGLTRAGRSRKSRTERPEEATE